MTNTKQIRDAINGLPDSAKLQLNVRPVYKSDEWGMNRYLTTESDTSIATDDLKALVAENEALRDLAERLKGEAEIHAQEARTANSTINEIYQVCSNATGEKGNWNGAMPVREMKADLEAKLATAREALDDAREVLAGWLIGVEYDESLKAYDIIDKALAAISDGKEADDER